MSTNAARMQEAVTAIALSHEDDCDCLMCLAACGDEDALSALEVQMALRGSGGGDEAA